MRRLLKMLFEVKPHDRLDRVPRAYAPDYDPHTIDDEVAKVMARSAARSPRNVELLLRDYHVATVNELLPLLPRRQPIHPRERLRRWYQRWRNLVDYEPVIRPALRKMDIPEDHGTLIRRTVWKDPDAPA